MDSSPHRSHFVKACCAVSHVGGRFRDLLVAALYALLYSLQWTLIAAGVHFLRRAMDNAENRYRKHIRGFSTVRFVAPVIDDRLLDYRSTFISHLPHC